MKSNKQGILIIFSLIIILFLGLLVAESDIFFQDKVSSRAKKVFLPVQFSRDYYG
jgi:hypothetical protein